MSSLADLVERLTGSAWRGSEADVQASVRDLLLSGRLNLAAGQVVKLEDPSGRRRIDITVGRAVIETKRQLPDHGPTADDRAQLYGYVAQRQADYGGRFVGILTDGISWSAWHLPASRDELEQVDSYQLRTTTESLTGLLVWLDGLMATQEALPPTADEVTIRLGAESSATKLDLATLAGLYELAGDEEAVALKRQLWHRLLTVASGTLVDDEDNTELFLEHTYLVVLAELIGHAVVGYDLTAERPARLLRGDLFADAGVYGVIEQDFFDWVGDTPAGLEWVAELAKRVARWDWEAVDHDVLKILYESVIGTDTRHRLGEYYTPDWLCKTIVEDAVDQPETQRVLDPACGSGTFLFWAVRHILTAHEKAGLSRGEALERMAGQVFGMDIHPVAVTLARITYLLAVGTERLQAPDRPRFSVPVYLGDAVQFETADDTAGVISSEGGELVVYAADPDNPDQPVLFEDRQRLVVPQEVIDRVDMFDQLIYDLTTTASNRQPDDRRPLVDGVLARHGVDPAHHSTLTRTYETLCDLHDDGRNHIWGYYLRNLARPRWLAQTPNRVDRIVGNPPWLSYRHMPDRMQQQYRRLAEERGLWAGRQVATHQDLSALFVVRAAEQFLKTGGRFCMVVPYATLSRQAYAGFRTGTWTTHPSLAEVLSSAGKQAKGLRGARATDVTVSAQFDQPWQLVDVDPDIFPVPSAVVRGTRIDQDVNNRPAPIPPTALAWTGGAPSAGTDLSTLETLEVPLVTVPGDDHDWSPYKSRFFQGATIVPRALVTVTEPDGKTASPLGMPSGSKQVVAHRSPQEKEPWKHVETIEGVIETEFLRPMHLGSTVLPFRLDEPWTAIIPWDGERLLEPTGVEIGKYPDLARWWDKAEGLWQQHRAKSALNYSLTDWLDYHGKLSSQFKWMRYPRVVYSASGSNLAAAVLTDPRAVIEHALYWCAAATEHEAHYLAAVLNAPVTTERVRPLQSTGAFGPRHIDKYVWALPIPHYVPNEPLHVELVALGRQAEKDAAAIDTPYASFSRNRRVIREALSDTMQKLDGLVSQLLVTTAKESDPAS